MLNSLRLGFLEKYSSKSKTYTTVYTRAGSAPTNSARSPLDISAEWRDSNFLRTRLARGHLSTALLIRTGSSFNRLKGCFPPDDVIFVETVQMIES